MDGHRGRAESRRVATQGTQVGRANGDAAAADTGEVHRPRARAQGNVDARRDLILAFEYGTGKWLAAVVLARVRHSNGATPAAPRGAHGRTNIVRVARRARFASGGCARADED